MKKIVDAFLVAAMLLTCVPTLQEDALPLLSAAPSAEMLLLPPGDEADDGRPHGAPC